MKRKKDKIKRKKRIERKGIKKGIECLECK